MRTTIDDVHHRYGQDTGGGTADIAIKRQSSRIGSSLGHRQRDAKDGVRAKLGLVRCTIKIEQHLIDRNLILGVKAEQCIGNDGLDMLDRLDDALAHIALLVAIAKLNRFHARRSKRRREPQRDPSSHPRESHRPRRSGCRGCREFARDDVDDGGHGVSGVLAGNVAPSLAEETALARPILARTPLQDRCPFENGRGLAEPNEPTADEGLRTDQEQPALRGQRQDRM